MAMIQYVSFAGTSDSYGEVPVAVLGGAEVFTIEAKISTTAAANNSNYYRWGTIAGRDLTGTWKNEWGFCVNNGKLCFWAQPTNNGSSSNYRTYSDAVVNDGLIHEVAVRSNADGSIDLFCDGQNVAHQDGVNAKITDAATMLIASNSGSNSVLAHQLYEMRCWNVARADADIFASITGNEIGLQAWYIPTSDSILVDKSSNGFNATLYNASYTEINSLPLSLYCDVARKVRNKNKTWVYGNLGDADLLSVSGTTLTNLPATQSKTGSAFYQTEREKCFDIPPTNEVWLRFDVYFDGNKRWRAYNGGANGTTGLTAQTTNTIYFWVNDAEIAHADNAATPNQLQTVLLHMISDEDNGIIEAWIDGNIIYRYLGDVNHGDLFEDIYLQSDGSDTFFSNVIISNSEVNLNSILEKVITEVDVARTLQKRIQLPLDVARRVLGNATVEVVADVKRKVVAVLNLSCDVSRKLYKTCENVLDVSIAGTISVLFAVDLERNLLKELNFFPTNNILQGEDTVTATSTERYGEIDNPLGLQSLELDISEQQLTDQITFIAVTNLELMQYVSGKYFDYPYELRLESKTKQGALTTYRCCHNLDQMLYEINMYPTTITKTVQDDTKPQTDTGDNDDDEGYDDDEDPELEEPAIAAIQEKEHELMGTGKYYMLSEWAEFMCAYGAGLERIVRLDDEYGTFYSSVSVDDLGGRNVLDEIRDIFGWSARLPHKMINVYIRANKLFVIQRGSEEHLIDITKTKHTQPTITQELVRTVWGATPLNYTAISEKVLGTRGTGGSNSDTPDSGEDPTSGDDDDDEKDNPWSAVGKVVTSNSTGTSTTTYDYTSDGVLMGTKTVFVSNFDEAQNSTTTVKHSYYSSGLLKSTITEILHSSAPEEDKRTETYYGYLTLADGKTFLSHETTAEYERNEIGVFELVDTNVITKNPTGRGQGTSNSSQGKGSASGNVGDDRVTPYQLRSAFKTTEALSRQTLKRLTSTTLNGFSDVDPSFPLLEYKARAKVTKEIKWLNRKIKETVSLNVYDFEHIIDFNDRIVLDGEKYFVSSNTVRTTSRIYNEQSLTLVRWIDSGQKL